MNRVEVVTQVQDHRVVLTQCKERKLVYNKKCPFEKLIAVSSWKKYLN